MHRMRRFFVLFGLVATSNLLTTGFASASLLKPGAGRAYPDIAADINGKVTYTYDAASKTGLFTVTNTPYLMAGGPTADQEYVFQTPGTRSQAITMLLDSTGSLLASSQNKYELFGTIVTPDKTYSGLLLSGTPTSFGSQDLGGSGVSGADIFDVGIDITGGALAGYFGSSAYMRITPELLSTFSGKFDENFLAQKATSNTRSYVSPMPFPIPEPSSWAVIALGVGGLIVRTRRLPRRG